MPGKSFATSKNDIKCLNVSDILRVYSKGLKKCVDRENTRNLPLGLGEY